MIIDFTTHADNQESQIEAYFSKKRMRYDLLPTCIKDFIQQHTGLYILIEKMLNRGKRKATHLSLAKNMIQNCEKVRIHSPKGGKSSDYFQKLIEKAEYSTSDTAKELSSSIHSLQCGLLNDNERKVFQSFKECWMKFINQQLNELIEEYS